MGTTVESDADKSAVLNGYFTSVFTIDDGSMPPLPPLNLTSTVGNVVFEADKVAKVIETFSNSFASGPDGYTSYFLKKLAWPLSVPLATIFEVSLHTHEVPNDWKLAHVIPIYKGKGPKHDPKNYRPISLTSVLCKVMEKVVRGTLLDHLAGNLLISPHQHGFLARHSTTTQLIEFLSWVTEQADAGNAVDIIYLDIAKAFDSVSHLKLLARLRQYGVSGDLLAWIKAFLTDRKQKVCLSDASSGWSPVTSGVPQGSVLGPILFLIFINEMVEAAAPANIKLYADDAKIYGLANTPQQAEIIADSMQNVKLWASRWQLNLAVQKCGVLHVGNGNGKFNYVLDGDQLSKFDSIDDLGVTIDGSLKPSRHVERIVSLANRRIGLLFHGFRSRDPKFLTQLFKIYIRPILEYCSSVWSPWLVRDRQAIEKVQRRFTRRLGFGDGVSYQERLARLDLEPLSVRRLKTDLVETFKIFNGDYALSPTTLFEQPPSSRTRGHPRKIYPPRSNHQFRKHFFSCRVHNFWNCLPSDVVMLPTVARFRRSVSELVAAEDESAIMASLIHEHHYE